MHVCLLLYRASYRCWFQMNGRHMLFGCIFGTCSFFWANSIAVINFSDFLLLLILFSIYFLVFGLLYRVISKSIGSWIIIGAPALWVTLEYIRSNLFFLSWPWNLLGHSQYKFLPVIQIADITGVYGISFILVMVNQFLSRMPELYAKHKVETSSNNVGNDQSVKWRTQLSTVFLVMIILFSYGWYKLLSTKDSGHIRVALIQANLLTHDNMTYQEQVKHFQEYIKLTMDASLKKPELIVWPASSLPAPISSRLVRIATRNLAIKINSYLLVGGAGHEKFGPQREGYLPYSNSEFLISPSGEIVGQYNKIRLLPFNEYLPMQGKFKWPQWITTLKANFISGKEYTLFRVSGASFGTPICWENMFPDMFRFFVAEGAQFMISVTNEGFFGNTSAPYQTLAMNAFRAVENRVAIVRANTTGVSCFINPNGKIIERVRGSNGNDLFVSGFLIGDIPLSNIRTFYTFYGDVFAYAALCITALFIILPVIHKKRNRLIGN